MKKRNKRLTVLKPKNEIIDGFNNLTCREVEGIKYYPGAHACRLLNYGEGDHCRVLQYYCKNVIKMPFNILMGKKNIKWISQGDLFRLITNSRRPEAEIIEEWLFDDVLVSVMNTGEYKHIRPVVLTGPLSDQKTIKENIREYLKLNK